MKRLRIPMPAHAPLFVRGGLAGAASLLVSTVAHAASSGEICVECTGPDKVYVCQVEKGEKVASFRAGLQALQFLCVSDLARLGGHAKCKARRDADNCLGTIHTVSIAEAQRAIVEGTGAGGPKATPEVAAPAQGSQAQGPGAAPRAGAPAASGATRAEPASPDKASPRTVKELAERTMGASQNQAKAAGDAVADGFAKSWKCVTTLFQKCF